MCSRAKFHHYIFHKHSAHDNRSCNSIYLTTKAKTLFKAHTAHTHTDPDNAHTAKRRHTTFFHMKNKKEIIEFRMHLCLVRASRTLIKKFYKVKWNMTNIIHFFLFLFFFFVSLSFFSLLFCSGWFSLHVFCCSARQQNRLHIFRHAMRRWCIFQIDIHNGNGKKIWNPI